MVKQAALICNPLTRRDSLQQLSEGLEAERRKVPVLESSGSADGLASNEIPTPLKHLLVYGIDACSVHADFSKSKRDCVRAAVACYGIFIRL